MSDLTPSQDELTPAQKIRADAKEATRRALLEAGLAETFEQGGELPTIDAVVERAGYTRGAFYFYFEDRDHFTAEMLEWMLAQLEVLTSSTTDSSASVTDVVNAFGALAAAGSVPGTGGSVRSGYLTILRALQPDTRIRESHANVMNTATERLEQRVRDDQASGDIRDDIDPAQLARLLQLTAIGLVMWSDTDIIADHQTLTGTLLTLLEG